VAAEVGSPGGWLLNMSYEWGCTTACLRLQPDAVRESGAAPVGPDPAPTLLHTLDWQLPGLGETVMVIRRRGTAGSWWTLAWPGFVGTVQGVAPGRFAACLNQAPEPMSGLGAIGDWLKGRWVAWRSRALPPALLLRRVFETCTTFAEACESLANRAVCLPVIYTITGVRPGEAAVIERLPDACHRHDPSPNSVLAVTNHWLNPDYPGIARSYATRARLAAIQAFGSAVQRGRSRAVGDGTVPSRPSWLRAPILNRLTQTAMVVDAATGRLWLQGFRQSQPVTQPLAICLSMNSPLQNRKNGLEF